MKKAETDTGRIPVHIVSGAPGSGKSALIAGLVGQRSDWLGLVNVLSARSGQNLQLLAAGCPCCTGRVMLQVTLVRALRSTGATRAFVEIGDAKHGANLERMLGELLLGRSVHAARNLELPRDAKLSASELQA